MVDARLLLSILAKRAQWRAHEHWPRQRLHAFQARRLQALRDRAYARSPFYREFHKGLFAAPLRELPVLTKATVMAHFDALATDRAVHLRDVQAFVANRQGAERFLGRYWVNATSGTSGHPGLFLANLDEWSSELATALRAFEYAGLSLSPTDRVRIAQITSTNPSHLSMQGGRDLETWFTPTLRMDAGEPLDSMVAKLNAWRPQMLWAYASVINLLAGEQVAGRLNISPGAVVSASELLTAGVRQRAVSAWGEAIFNTYATTDCGGLGAECDQHRGMHLLEDLAIIEVVDHDNRAVAPGVFADKLLVTVLGGQTQPLIRYELEDSVRLASAPCTCGRPFRLIDAVQGRIEETLSFAASAGGVVAVHPVVFSRIMDTLPVTAWQVVQESDGLHVLMSGPSRELDDAPLAERIRQALIGHGVAPPVVRIDRVSSIPRAENGKTPLVTSRLTPAHFRAGATA